MKLVIKALILLIFPVLLFAQYTGGSGDGFAVWTSSGDVSLPVELLAYRYFTEGKAVTLEWETASEVNNAGFMIMKKNPSETDFIIIDSYTGNSGLKGCGSSGFGKKYRYIDQVTISGAEFIYQAWAIDFSGAQHFVFQTDIIRIKDDLADDNNTPESFSVAGNYPNPFNPGTRIRFENSEQTNVKITVYNLLGEIIQILTDHSFERGRHELEFIPGAAQASQVFICRVESGNMVKFFKMTYAK
jgi:hypothetical protein